MSKDTYLRSKSYNVVALKPVEGMDNTFLIMDYSISEYVIGTLQKDPESCEESWTAVFYSIDDESGEPKPQIKSLPSLKEAKKYIKDETDY